MKRKYFILIVIVISFFVLRTSSFAMEQYVKFENEKVFENAVLVKTSVKTIDKKIDADSSMMPIISKVFGVVAYICYAAAFIVMVVKGVQLAAAAPEAKAQIKKQMIAIAVGAGIVFAISSILTIIKNVTDNLF